MKLSHVPVKTESQSSAILHLKWDYYLEHSQEITSQLELRFLRNNLALGWILEQGDFLNLLRGSTTVDQIRENVKSAELELDPEDVAFMRESAEAIDK